MPFPKLDERICAGALMLASGLQIAESLVPRIPLFPWLRLGFSWAVMLPFLSAFGTLPALGLFLSRNILSVAFGGQPPTTFLISSLSGTFAILVLGRPLRIALERGWLGWVGAGILQAVFFNLAQLYLVTWLLVGHGGYLFQAGPILAWSVVSGAVVAWLASRWFPPKIWEHLAAWDVDVPAEAVVSRVWWISALGWGGLCVATAFLERPIAVGVALALCLANAILRRRTRDLSLVLQAWPYFLFLAWFHLLDTPGHLVGAWVTREGIQSFLVHAGRLSVFLLAGSNLVRCLPWTTFLANSPWARAVGLVLPALPRLFQASVSAAREAWAQRNDPQAPSFPLRLLGKFRP